MRKIQIVGHYKEAGLDSAKVNAIKAKKAKTEKPQKQNRARASVLN